MNLKKLFLFAIISGSLIIACSKKSSDDTTDDADSAASIAEQAFSEASSHASATEGGSVSTSSISEQMELMSNELQQINDSQQKEETIAAVSNACSYATKRTCSGTTGTIDWNNCTISVNGVTVGTMTGGWTETWSNSSDCTNSYLAASGTVTRTSTGSTLTFPVGRKIVTDTSGGTAYDGTVLASGGVKTTRAASGSGRTIAMYPTNSAVHKVATSRRGASLFDYYVQPNISVTGALKNTTANGLGTSRTMSGTVTIYHNLVKYTATNTFNSVVWGDSTCCYPTSGTVTATYSGTNKPADSSTMTFSTTCGSATFASTSGSSTTSTSVTLENCQ